ncbi:PQQ-dependent sugar dehydrogenase [Lacibacter sp.]|uniref:PQQ-dependent sugar dehydrogenase n=1 Tax=Lacibacter sp. TaxID=1915409 RepID=UPI002B4B50E3|nr:PQQ-dependent sugar dehydrogenase [Lacibacter sp.]HLP37643.1 PQQ-dependent sugar dehydrogenase [Lacibacter sp.]
MKQIPALIKVVVVILTSVFCYSFAISKRNDDGSSEKRIRKIYAQNCSGCHGEIMEAFVDRNWKYGTAPDSIFKSIKKGSPDFGMPSFNNSIKDRDIRKMAEMFVHFIEDVNSYKPKNKLQSNVFETQEMKVQLDTIATGMLSPWGFAQLPGGDYLITDRSGELYRVDQHRNKTLIKGTPKVLAEGQGGLLDLKLHPAYEDNGWVYLSYSKFKKPDSIVLTTTAIVRGKIKDNEFTEVQEIFEALPYTRTKHHFGSKLMFDDKGYLYFSVGERGNEKQFPQSTENDNGKIHRIFDDGRIPPDNPFINDGKSKATIWSYGHRNPQGLIFEKSTGIIWETEHGPRGGDELNIIRKGANYGWPLICNCINYNGKPITNLTQKEGMEQAETYWIPSIAPCGMTMITSDRYPAWKGNIMVGSLRYMYLDRIVLKNNKVVKQEKLFSGLGRMRNAEMGRDGYLYIAVEKPGMVFRVKPI